VQWFDKLVHTCYSGRERHLSFMLDSGFANRSHCCVCMLCSVYKEAGRPSASRVSLVCVWLVFFSLLHS
jgi:hypothetical protein